MLVGLHLNCTEAVLLNFKFLFVFRDLNVLYGGNEMFDYEIDTTFWNDMKLSLITLALIVIFMLILTSFSVWLTFWGIFSIVLSFPMAFFFYREVFGVVTLGILNGAAAFVIIGIGKFRKSNTETGD